MNPNPSLQALYQTWLEIWPVGFWLIILTLYGWMMFAFGGYQKSKFIKSNMKDLIPEIHRRKLEELNTEIKELKQRNQELEESNKKLNAHIKAQIEHNTKVINDGKS